MNTVELAGAVITLHDVARQVEQELGNGALSQSIRQSADKLSDIVKEEKRKAEK